jgi:hypothetical protein
VLASVDVTPFVRTVALQKRGVDHHDIASERQFEAGYVLWHSCARCRQL